MDMQADIKWIQAQVEMVKDPSLIDMLKRLIQYGQSKKEEIAIPESYYQLLEKELEETPSHKWEEVKKELMDTYNL